MHRMRRYGHLPQTRCWFGIMAIMAFAWTVQAYGQEASDDEDVESERLELLQRWESAGLVKTRPSLPTSLRHLYPMELM